MFPADSPRLIGEDSEHIRLLAESGVQLPPILVHRPTMRVVDGMHRLGAAQLLGHDTIQVQFLDSSEADAFVTAVKANVAHGLPLSFADREAAARRIMVSHPHFSDRAIAAITGLAPRTVAAVRRRAAADAPPAGAGQLSVQPAARLGRDGRIRPLDSTEARRRASQIIAARPDASLREVARMVGISPATARDVRQRMRRGDDPVPAGQGVRGRRSRIAGDDGARERPAERSGQRARKPVPADKRAVVLQNLKNDPSLRFAESGRRMLRWLFAHAVQTQQWREFLPDTPPHCAYILAGVARGCANDWLEFATELEQMANQRHKPGAA